MFGSETLELLIGMVFVFLLVSMICTAVREGIEAWLKTRAAYLEHGIRELLQDSSAGGLAKALYEHPLIAGLYEGKYTPAPSHAERRLLSNGRLLPSYIPSRSFALAIMDLAARGPADASTSGAAAAPLSVQTIRDNIANIQNPAVQRVLLTAVDAAGDDLDRVRKNVEAWFDSGMDRVSGWYKRSTQVVLLLIGLFVAVALNINAITIFNYLSHNDTARKVIVASAGNATTDSAYLHRTLEQNRAALDSLRLPIGWDNYQWALPGTLDSVAVTDAKGTKTYRHFTVGVWDTVFQPLFGWLVIALAATLGAPFWFDVLNRLVVLRSTVKPHEKSPEEASKDRQTPTPTPGSQGGEADEQERVAGGGGTGSGSGAGTGGAGTGTGGASPGTGAGGGGGTTGDGGTSGGGGGASPGTGASGSGGATGDGGTGGTGAGDDDEADGDDVEVTEPTPDEELPAAEGGVA